MVLIILVNLVILLNLVIWVIWRFWWFCSTFYWLVAFKIKYFLETKRFIFLSRLQRIVAGDKAAEVLLGDSWLDKYDCLRISVQWDQCDQILDVRLCSNWWHASERCFVSSSIRWWRSSNWAQDKESIPEWSQHVSFDVDDTQKITECHQTFPDSTQFLHMNENKNIFKCNLFIMAFLLFLYNKNTGCKIKQPDGPSIIFWTSMFPERFKRASWPKKGSKSNSTVAKKMFRRKIALILQPRIQIDFLPLFTIVVLGISQFSQLFILLMSSS